MPKNILAIAIIEKEVSRDAMLTWCFPSLAPSHKEALLSHCKLEDGLPQYFHHGSHWYYLQLTESSSRQVWTVLQTGEFGPHKYGPLVQKLALSSSNPVQLVQLYLNVIVSGLIPGQLEPEFDVNHVIKTFGLEAILIYTAVLLKKRILVYHHKSEPLLNFLSALPALAWHRQDWSMLWPLADISQLCGPHYIAGINTASMESRTDLYDLYVNLPAVELAVAPHAKELFGMSKTHKEIAVSMVRSASSNCSNLHTIQEVAHKTGDILNYLRTLGEGSPRLSLPQLQAAHLPQALETFLWNLALAEGMASL